MWHYQVTPQFQFHKGTIRTDIISQLRKPSQPFQFHKGTIRTIYSRVSTEKQTYFNSIKVQLEQTYNPEVFQAAANFNSIKVQLEPVRDCRLRIRKRRFQFHKGTIRTFQDKCSCLLAFRYFNSIKVQLEHNIGKRLLVPLIISIP